MKKLSYIAIGLIVGLLIGLTSTAYAQDVTAAFSKFIFIVNGDEKPLDGDPLVYQGSTYLPVRTVANILGYDVTYKADSKTIELTKPQATGQTLSSPTGGAPAVNDPATTGVSVEGIDFKLNGLRIQLKNAKGFLDGGYATTDEARAKTQKDIQDTEAKISELEKQKADLEAQAAPTPTP